MRECRRSRRRAAHRLRGGPDAPGGAGQDVAGAPARSLGAALLVTNLLIESRTKRRHAASVGLKDDQETILGFGIDHEIAAAITQIGMELAFELITVGVFDFRDGIPHSYGDASGSSVPLEAGVGESSAGMDPETLGCSIGPDVESS
jgi:hypothetical protein